MIKCTFTNLKTIQINDYEKHIPLPRLRYYVPQKHIKVEFSESILQGLLAQQKYIDSKFFYDKRGSEIFENICKLPEYYLTRIETEILEQYGSEIVSLFANNSKLVELGSGSATKTKILLEAMNCKQTKVTYCPIDISNVLVSSSHTLLESYNWLEIIGVNDIYENGLCLIHQDDKTPALIVFLGSSIGNMDSAQAHKFLCMLRTSMSVNDILLVGLDLKKDKKILINAYNDTKGITAEFNFNLLDRINYELGVNIDTSKFTYFAKYNESESRIESYLKSKQEQIINICGNDIKFGSNELILTEYSHKYSTETIQEMVTSAKLCIKQTWYDSNHQYALVACSMCQSSTSESGKHPSLIRSEKVSAS